LPTIYELKPRFQAALRPLCARLAGAGVTANGVTLAALALAIAHGAWIALDPRSAWALLLLPVTLLIRMALNAIDGMLAREHGQQSKLGAILNELSDVIADAALYLPLALVPGVNAAAVVSVVVAGIVAEMAGALGPSLGASRRYDGPMGKSDRAAAFGLLAFLIGAGLGAGVWSTAFLLLLLVLSVLTIVNRARGILTETDR
jgi:CDP-diacylglycerol---glycerol-3-phosphate 3-phosphatidyltransferase